MRSLRFLIPSFLGVLIFLTPLPWDGNTTIGIGIITGWVKGLMGPAGIHFVVAILVLTSLLTILGTTFKSTWIDRHTTLKELFDVTPSWYFLRLVGTLFGVLYLFQIGPDVLISESVGGAVFKNIGINVLAIYISACLLLPLLTDFGFMEFVGTLARPFFRRVFGLPGRSAIDAVTSFVGASSIGLLITIGEYEKENYTAREASVIATNFSVVSIPFCLVVASVAGIEEIFISWYGCVVIACLLAALITPRLPPLSTKADVFLSGDTKARQPEAEDSGSLLREAWEKALARAANSPGVKGFLLGGVQNIMFFAFSVLTAAMALAVFAALITFHTPIFTWLSWPFIGLLEFAGIADASAAGPALFSGYLDQYMPALVASNIDSVSTSFFLAGLSVCQLIFMSELGVIILRSSLPLSLKDLTLIFLLRTAIVSPVLILGAHFVVAA